jgi:Chalcone isomerase-like
MRRAAAALALLLAASTPAVEVAGVNVPDTATVGGRTLVLNGAGLRRKFFIHVYVGALYLEARQRDPAAILAADAPWKVSMYMRRDVDHQKIVGAFKEGFENNSPGQIQSFVVDLERFEAVLKDLKQGQQLDIAYLPGAGTTMTTPGGETASVSGAAFGQALLRTWLGKKPADQGLKDAMLGR